MRHCGSGTMIHYIWDNFGQTITQYNTNVRNKSCGQLKKTWLAISWAIIESPIKVNHNLFLPKTVTYRCKQGEGGKF